MNLRRFFVYMDTKISKENVLILLKRKRDGTLHSSFKQLEMETGYSKGHLKKLYKQLATEDIETLSKHKNTGLTSHNAACNDEISYIVKFKELYPKISVAQFKDVYEEDIVLNKDYEDDVIKYHLQVRSYGFYLDLFHKMKWVSPIKHKVKKNTNEHLHLLRKPSDRKGHLIQIDGTPYDWFGNGEMWTLHLAVDDATTDMLAGWFTRHECLFGYCKMFELILKKHGIPSYVYSDRHTILKSAAEDGDTIFRKIMRSIGIEQIYAMSAEAKGRIERANGTVQRRLPIDIKRFKIKDYNELNVWFNDFYIPYINKKFAYTPIDPNSEFEEICDENFNYNRLFSVKFTRVMGNNSMFHFENNVYSLTDKETGELIYIRKGVKIDVVLEILTKRIYAIYHLKEYECVNLGPSSKYRRQEAGSVKELDEILDDLDRKKQ